MTYKRDMEPEMNAYFRDATYGLSFVVNCVSHETNIDDAIKTLENLETTFYNFASKQYARYWDTQIIGYLDHYKKYKTIATVITIALQDLRYLKLTYETDLFAEYKYLFLTPKIIQRSVYESVANF